MTDYKINLIGAGNVATHLGMKLISSCQVLTVFSNKIINAQKLSDKLGSKPIDDLSNLNKDANLNIVAIKDSALPAIIDLLPKEIPTLITAGTFELKQIIEFENSGILYPLQTFTKDRPIDLSTVPFLIESKKSIFENEIINFVSEVFKAKSYKVSSEKRKFIHLSAVISCNFSNRLISEAKNILDKENLDYQILRPLILETVNKAFDMDPVLAQTGPAVRGDDNIIIQHLAMLDTNEMKEVYGLITNLISGRH